MLNLWLIGGFSVREAQGVCDDPVTTTEGIISQCGECSSEGDILNCEWSGERTCLRITWTEEVEAWWTEERFNEQSNNSMIFFCNGEPVEIPVCLGPFWIEDTDCGTTEINGTEYPIYHLCGELQSGSCDEGEPGSTSCSVGYCQELWPGTEYAACSETTGWGDYSCGPDREYYGARDTDDCNTDPDNYCVCCGDPGSKSPSCDLSANPDNGFDPLSTNLSMSAEGSSLDSWQLTYGDGAQECNPGPCSGNPDGLTRNHIYNTGDYTATMTLWNQAGESATCVDDIEVGIGIPQNLHHTANTPYTLGWAWDPVGGATSYKAYVYDGIGIGGAYWLLGTVTETEFSHSQYPVFLFFFLLWLPIGGNGIPWNWPYTVGVLACNGAVCSPPATATAATSIESPTLITKVGETLNGTNSSFTIRVDSNERWGLGFSALNQGNSAVRTRIRRLPSGFPEQTIDWRSGPGLYGRPADFVFSGLLEGSEYEVCAQSRNRDGIADGVGDYRPGPTASDWNCENISVGTLVVSCTPDTDQACCENPLANVDLTATKGLAPGLICTGATGNTCWAPAGGFVFPPGIPQGGEMYQSNCCGDDLGEAFDGGNVSCDGTHACCPFGLYVEGGNCVSDCSVNQPPDPPIIEPPISFEGSIAPSKTGIHTASQYGSKKDTALSKKKTNFLAKLSANLFDLIIHNIFKK